MLRPVIASVCFVIPTFYRQSLSDTEYAPLLAPNANSCTASKVDKFKAALAAVRRHEDEIRQRWMRDEDGWRKLPARAWPEYQPPPSEIPHLRQVVASKCGEPLTVECQNAKFDLATAFVFNHLQSTEGIELYHSLAKEEYPDGLTALAVCYLEGLGVSQDAATGVKWLQRAVERQSLQAHYELGGLYYYGAAAPIIEENDASAFKYFEYTSQKQHTSGLYMTADMLLAGQGCEVDAAKAVELLYTAGERGHRLARTTLLRLLRDEERIIRQLEAVETDSS